MKRAAGGDYGYGYGCGCARSPAEVLATALRALFVYLGTNLK